MGALPTLGESNGESGAGAGRNVCLLQKWRVMRGVRKFAPADPVFAPSRNACTAKPRTLAAVPALDLAEHHDPSPERSIEVAPRADSVGLVGRHTTLITQ